MSHVYVDKCCLKVILRSRLDCRPEVALIFCTPRLQTEAECYTLYSFEPIINNYNLAYITFLLLFPRPKSQRYHFWKEKYVIHILPDDIKSPLFTCDNSMTVSP